MVGYSTFDLAQYYADPNITKAVIGFLRDHYYQAAFKSIQANNGLASVTNTGAARFVAGVAKNILQNRNGWNTDIGNFTACAGQAGR